MAKLTPDYLVQLADHQFGLRHSIKSMWQVIAEHFYPERADFEGVRNVGREYADHLSDSFPLLVRRDLGNSLAAMLRDGQWFLMGVNGKPDHAGRIWLQESTDALYKYMYHRSAGFVRATNQADHDYVTFGQCAISVEPNRRHGGLLFRSWHLRDCAWWEDETGQVSGVVRTAKPTRRELVDYFGADKLTETITQDLDKMPFVEFDILHMVIPSEMYGDDALSRFPYVSLYVDKANRKIIEESGLRHKMYCVPRFQTIAGSAYAYSPATSIGIADSRVLQAMTHTLMEAAERYARPPLVAQAKVVSSGINLRADGITYVDNEYDERLGESLRELYQSKNGWPIGAGERERVVETLESAFFLNKLTLPDPGQGDMTAYEVSERMKQFRRQNLPLFAPIEAEYSGQVCELAFEVAMNEGLLGSIYDIPESLRDQDVQFKFESPLSTSEEEEKVQQFHQVRDMLAGAFELDQTIGAEVDLPTALRDAIMGIAPQRWLRSVNEAAKVRELAQMAAMARDAMEMENGRT